MKIIHIVEASTWKRVKNKSEYFGDSLQSQGFIHCCLPTQVDFVVNTWFAGREDLVFLKIDSEKLTARLIFENLEGEEEKFPHIYGPINKDAIIGWYPSRKTIGN